MADIIKTWPASVGPKPTARMFDEKLGNYVFYSLVHKISSFSS